ncbi:MAG TPA: hypothetical protein VFQ53_42965 [Kofleriaceae bacterium]|nr:hypothetical protein [Kofleriaceae bacterium]
MRWTCTFAFALAACGTDASPLQFVDAAPELARPLVVSGTSRYELWAVAEPVGGTARIAQTRDGGETWRVVAVPDLAGDAPIQLGADGKGKVWALGSAAVDRAPLLVEIQALTLEPIVRVHAIFPAGTSEVTLHTGGFDPDPMITARVPDTTGLVLFVYDEYQTGTWYRHPMTEIASLVGIYTSDGGYFLRGAPGSETLEFCSLPADGPHCFEVPAFTDNAGIYASNPAPSLDWLWRIDPDGGTVVQRTGIAVDIHHVTGWPTGLEPIRFFALRNGDRAVLGQHAGSLSWVWLDGAGQVEREVLLGDCDCTLDPDRVSVVRDSTLVIPAANGWYATPLLGL